MTKIRLSVTVDAEVAEAIDALCRQSGRNRSQEVEHLCRRALERQREVEDKGLLPGGLFSAPWADVEKVIALMRGAGIGSDAAWAELRLWYAKDKLDSTGKKLGEMQLERVL